MMKLQVIFSLLLLTLAIATASSKCSNNEKGSNFTLSITSHRNFTGHRIVMVDVKREDFRSGLPSLRSSEMNLLLGHAAVSCAESETVQMSASATVSEVGVPRSDYERFFGLGYYKLHTAALSWHNAQSKCLEEGAHLIVLNSAQEGDVIKTFFSRRPTLQGVTPGQGHLCHVGYTDYQQEGQFVSVLGTPISKSGYVVWGSGQPSGGTGENCLVSDSGAVYWDAPCQWTLMFICEYGS